MIGEYIAYRIGRSIGRHEHPPPPVAPTSYEAARDRAIGWFIIACIAAAAIIGFFT